MYRAAKMGHLEVLRWARQHGCRVDIAACKESATFIACGGPHTEVLAWLDQLAAMTA